MTKPYNPGPPFERNSAYGIRIDPISGKPNHHAGEDFRAPAGTPIPAATSGQVVYSGFNEGFGNVVIVKNSAGGYNLYGHMLDGVRAKIGQLIWPGDAVGFVGSTGKSTGNHLHYSVIKDDAGKGIKRTGEGGSIGISVRDATTLNPADYDPSPRYLDETRHAAQIMSGAEASMSSGTRRPARAFRSSGIIRQPFWKLGLRPGR